MSELESERRKALRSKYSIPVEDRPDDGILTTRWHIQSKERHRVILEPIEDEEANPYTKVTVEKYISRISRYDTSRPDCFDTVSRSYNAHLGRPMTSRLSNSYAPVGGSNPVSSGWRPWSKVATTNFTTSPAEVNSFDRLYSRSYQRNYARPYNVDSVIPVASYSTSSTSSSKARYNTAGSYQTTLSRPNRDYKSRLGGDYGVKSYDRKTTELGRDTSLRRDFLV